jgi:PIN domain nuclease of toxin-antitoxin system
MDAILPDQIAISAISCWEVAMLSSLGKISFQVSLREWMGAALSTTGITLLPLTPDIAIESAHLPGVIHRDPADRILIATARVHACPLITADEKILAYQHVKSFHPSRITEALPHT